MAFCSECLWWEARKVLSSKQITDNGQITRHIIQIVVGNAIALESVNIPAAIAGESRATTLSGTALLDRYWLAINFFRASGSSENIFILIKGSLPFCVSIDQALGLARRSLTLPWDSPSTFSPNNLWLIEYWLSSSLTCQWKTNKILWKIHTRWCQILSNKIFRKYLMRQSNKVNI